MSKNLKMIAVNESNYGSLKKIGTMGMTFNDVIGELLKLKEQQEQQQKKRN
jgi:predicted CopG family antitoxin